ncbi:predicted protein [Chaetoceros tenuissimus]|uniref:Uncharacterized protein n=1 Tax=Chaetoceros tenuissimus TaxID=426638 RepID=A0AAD3H3V0_9STRA|nr:predicted protein [Chaetoceros tenuissimus]
MTALPSFQTRRLEPNHESLVSCHQPRIPQSKASTAKNDPVNGKKTSTGKTIANKRDRIAFDKNAFYSKAKAAPTQLKKVWYGHIESNFGELPTNTKDYIIYEKCKKKPSNEKAPLHLKTIC